MSTENDFYNHQQPKKEPSEPNAANHEPLQIGRRDEVAQRMGFYFTDRLLRGDGSSIFSE